MSSWLNETKVVKQIASSMLTPKKIFYQEDFINFKMMELKHLSHSTFYFINGFHERLKASLFTQRNSHTTCCIVYLHGFGSHRLEGVTLLSELPKKFAFCCFDFSGSGKSQGSLSAYGIKEYQDIKYAIKKLKQIGYTEFVLWGRSMGAVASLLATSLQDDKSIIFQVLDSPFSSFEKVAHHYAQQTFKVPEVVINVGLSIMKQFFKEKQFNPFEINILQHASKCKVPALFVYCENDQVIPPQNTLKISEAFPFSTRYEKLQISENHNNVRSEETLKNIYSTISKYMVKSVGQGRKNRKGLFEVLSKTPKSTKRVGEDFRMGKIQCSLSKQRAQSIEKGHRIRFYNPESSRESICFHNCSKTVID